MRHTNLISLDLSIKKFSNTWPTFLVPILEEVKGLGSKFRLV